MKYALLLLLLGCATPDQEFKEIGRHPAIDHNCDDMAQEYRDVLVERGVPVSELRLVQGYKGDLVHMWLERRMWVVFDPFTGVYHGEPYEGWKTMPMHGASVYRDGGYMNRGDRYRNGEW